MKKLTALLLMLVMSIGLLAGCGGGGTAVVEEDPNTVPEDPYEINWYLMSDEQKDMELVEAEINKYLKDKINATVNITCLPSAQYSQKLGAMINANEYFDMAFAARWMLSYVENSRAGAFFQLDDYLDTYLKGITDEYGKENLNYAKIDGGLYGLPVYKEMVTHYGWVYRKDLAEKYDIDMTKIKNFRDLIPALDKIKAGEPDMKYPLDWPSDGTPSTLGIDLMVSQDTWLMNDSGETPGKILNFYETEEFAKNCAEAREFYEKGYIRPDILTATDQTQRMKEGKTFVMLLPLKPGKAQEAFAGSAYEFAQAEITDPKMDYLAGTGSVQVISANSKNPVRVMRFMNLLNTDRYLMNLVLHGIEGKHYTRVDEKTIEQIPDSGYDMHGNSWAIGNVFLSDLLTTEDPNKLEDLKEFNGKAVMGEVDMASARFCPAPDEERDRLKQELNAVVAKYKKQLVLGAVDPEPTIKEFNEQLKKVGADEYVAQTQKLYDEFVKTLK